jgi:zinc transporter 1/2/3
MASFDPANVNLDNASLAEVVCYMNASGNDYNGQLGARVSSIFVILFCSTAATFFPVVAQRIPSLKIPVYVYLFARYVGTGVIIATAFIHLLDPAYGEIGPNTCVGLTGNWTQYSWVPAIVLAAVMVVFLMDFGAELYVESKYGIVKQDDRGAIVQGVHLHDATNLHDHHVSNPSSGKENLPSNSSQKTTWNEHEVDSIVAERSFRQQIAAFLILEFGVMFHSVIIGLNLGVAGDEFATLYPVLVFHQSFEGLGIGARMSAIPFKRNSWLPWILCSAYGLTTPISIAIGLGVRNTYNPNSNTANIVSGVLDSISAGILIYTGLVELMARDFLFDPDRTNDRRRLGFMIITMLLGAGVMALLGKWA